MTIASGRNIEGWRDSPAVVAGPWLDGLEILAADDEPTTELDALGLPRGALASIARAFQNVLERYSGTVTRRIVGGADELGLDGLYVAMIVMRQREASPSLRGEDRRALEFAGRLMSGFAMLPGTGDMQVPPTEADVLIDRVLANVAAWARVRLIPDLKHEYMALLEEHAERLRPTLESLRAQASGSVLGQDPLADRPAITIALMERFEHWLASGSTLASRRAMLGILDRLFSST